MSETANTVKFKKPYSFEGVEYTEVDLSGADKLTVADLIDVQKQLTSDGDTAAMALAAMEATTPFAIAIATKVTGKPAEFFEQMRAAPMKQVQEAIQASLNPEIDSEGATLKLSAPYIYAGSDTDKKGRTFTEVDLSGAGELNALQISAAESRMVRAGFPTLNKERVYQYLCSIASMVSGLPEDFFTALPAKDGISLRNVVNGEGFFE